MRRPGETPGSTRPIEAVSAPLDTDPTWDRLEDQINWYDRKSGDNQHLYKWLKPLEIAAAASLPVVAAVHSPVWVTAAAVLLFFGQPRRILPWWGRWRRAWFVIPGDLPQLPA